MLVASAAVASAQAVQSHAGAARPSFGSSVEVVALNVTVTQPPHGYLRDLGADDFVVYEDGVAQRVTVFGAGDVPIDLVLLLDLSASVRDRVNLVRSAAKGFLRTLRPEDRGAVIGFNESVRVLANLTHDGAELARAVDAVSAAGGTSLYTAIYIGLRGLDPPRSAAPAPADEAGQQIRRRVLVVLSDGQDTSSLVSYDDVVEACRRSGVLLYTILLEAPVAIDLDALLPNRQVRPTGEYVMTNLARETGARTFDVVEPTTLPRVYADIATELSSQYVLGYVPGPPRESRRTFHTLSVAVPRHVNAQARARAGYLREPNGRGIASSAATVHEVESPSVPHR